MDLRGRIDKCQLSVEKRPRCRVIALECETYVHGASETSNRDDCPYRERRCTAI